MIENGAKLVIKEGKENNWTNNQEKVQKEEQRREVEW